MLGSTGLTVRGEPPGVPATPEKSPDWLLGGDDDGLDGLDLLDRGLLDELVRQPAERPIAVRARDACAAAYRLLIERGVAGEVYNVASGRGIALLDVVDRLMAAIGHRAILEADPTLSRPNDLTFLVGNSAKLARDTGVDLRTVPPTGPHGRVTKDDVRGAKGGGTRPAAIVASTASSVGAVVVSFAAALLMP